MDQLVIDQTFPGIDPKNEYQCVFGAILWHVN